MGEKAAAIVLAAGQGKRMQSKVQKQYLLIQDKPVLYYALKTFEESRVEQVVLVVGQGEEAYCREQIVEKYGFGKVKAIVEGGKERYHSVYAGLQAIAEDMDFVLIHDGARPFVTQAMIARTLEAVQSHGACIVGMPVKDTIKIADSNGFTKETPPRSQVWMIQTPQVFRCDLIREAYAKLIRQEESFLQQGIVITDDAMVVELLGNCSVKLVEGSYQNIKITTPEDLEIAEIYVKNGICKNN